MPILTFYILMEFSYGNLSFTARKLRVQQNSIWRWILRCASDNCWINHNHNQTGHSSIAFF
jgi:hypothetical protein